MQDRPTFGVLSTQDLCHLCSVANTTENFSESKLRKKKSKFLVYGKLWSTRETFSPLKRVASKGIEILTPSSTAQNHEQFLYIYKNIDNKPEQTLTKVYI